MCAASQGVSDRQVNDWMNKGQQIDPEPQYERFANEVLIALGEGQMELYDLMKVHAVQDWRAAKTLIDGMMPEDKTTRIEISGEVDHYSKIELVSNQNMLDVVGLLTGFYAKELDVVDVELGVVDDGIVDAEIVEETMVEEADI
jgi:hypothetical protein